MHKPSEHFVFVCTIGMASLGLWLVYLILLQRKNYLDKKRKSQILELETQKELLSDLIAAQEKERARIAQNLHDEIGVQLSMLKLNLSRYRLDNCTHEGLLNGLASELTVLEKTIEDISGICHDLYPINLRRFGLIKCLIELLSSVENNTNIILQRNILIAESELLFNEDQKLNLLRACQELVNNLIKHANVRHLNFSMEKVDRSCHISFKHDGTAFTNEMACDKVKQGKSFGLNSIANRIHVIQGEINYQKNDAGSTVYLKIPISNEA